MSVPGPPVITLDPRSTNQTLQFVWGEPTTGTPILGYRFNIDKDNPSPSYIELPADYRYIQLSGLINGTTYSATIEASNVNGYGTIAYFRPFQPGSILPGPPSTATAVAVRDSALISWTPPLNSGSLDAPIQWYTIYSQSTNPSDPIISVTANGLTQSNYFITGLNTTSLYSFNVYAINCPGWSPFTNTGTIGFVPVFDYVFEASFPSLTNTTDFSNYDSNRLMVNTPTGSGYSYLTTDNYTTSNSLYKSISPITTNSASFICSIYRTFQELFAIRFQLFSVPLLA
jgi:hypothetical protein